MKSWKKRLNDEFDCVASALSDDVINAPIITRQSGSSAVQNGSTLVKRRVGIGAACAAALIAVIVALLGICGVFSRSSAPFIEKFVFTLEINPAVSFITDKNGCVLSVHSLNADADVILSDENELDKLKDVTVAEAAVAYTDCAARLGYFDLTKSENAVRLSSSVETDKDLLDGASESLSGYFKSNGVYAVVVADVLTAGELSARLGLSDGYSLSDLADTIESRPILYGGRIAADAAAEELEIMYNSYIVGTQLLTLVREELLGNLEKIVDNAKMLSQIGLCSYNIMLHRDNPFSPLPADYWTVKKYPNAEYSPEFAELMGEMDGLIEKYQREFGTDLDSLSDLTSALDVYSSLSGVDFKELFSSLSAEDFQSAGEKYLGMLKNIGCDVTSVEALLYVPQTVREYLEQMQTALRQQFNRREERYKEIYGQEREEISEADYDEFIKGLETKYGSLENFWNKI